MASQERKAPTAFLARPRSLVEISDAGDLLGMDVLFEPQHQWIAEEYLATDVPHGWAACIDADSDRVYYWNESTQETRWENPAESHFAELYRTQRRNGEASGVAIFQLASRAAAREREVEMQKGVAREAGASSPTHNASRRASTAGAGRAPTQGGRRASMKWEAPDGAMGPTQFIELAEYLGITMQCEPNERECHLLNFVGDYLDRSALNSLPPDWAQYADESGATYYYNEVTGESTYDYPVLMELSHKIQARRKIMSEDPELGPAYKGSEIHRYWAFSNGRQVYYYNMKTGERRDKPPDIGTRATTLVQKRVRGFLARLRMKLAGKRRVAEAGGVYASGTLSQWNLLASGKEEEPEAGESAESQAASMLALETDKWEREKAQRDVKSKLEVVLKKYNESIEFGGDGRWTMAEFSTVLNLLKRANVTGLSNPDDEFRLKAGALVEEVQELVHRFEEAEGKRRAELKRKRLAEEQARQLADKISAVKDMVACKDRLKTLRKMEFTEAKANPAVNGQYYDSARVKTAFHKAEGIVNEAIAASPKAPTDPMDDLTLANLMKLVAKAKLAVAAVEREVNLDMRKRREKEYEAKIKADAAAVRAAADATAAAEAAKVAEAERAKAAEDEQARRKEMEAKLKRDYEARIQREKERKAEMEAERKRMEEELRLIREEREKREAAEKERLEQWNLMTFATEQDRDEVMTQRYLEQAKREKEEEEARQAEEDRKARLKKQMEDRRRAIMEQQARIAREMAEREAEEKRLQAVRMEQEAAFREEQRRRAEVEAERVEQEKRRLAEIERQRALMDEGDSDTEEEKAARELAKQRLERYPGDVWKAARDNDVPMLRAFFLVKGTRRLLAAHNKAKTEGGRTLVHTAAWWGCDDVLRFLVALGANVNARDTMFCRTTPLMEAVRAGRRATAELLLESGADISLQDFSGDTALHWAARRGWGTLLLAVLRKSESVAPGSTRGVIETLNKKKMSAMDCAANATVRELIAKEARTGVKKDKRRAAAMLRVKKGLAKAKIVGGNAAPAAHHIKAQRMRYGRLRKGQQAAAAGRGAAAGGTALGEEAGLQALGLF